MNKDERDCTTLRTDPDEAAQEAADRDERRREELAAERVDEERFAAAEAEARRT